MSESADEGDIQTRLEAQFTEYLIRIDRGEAIDRAKFLHENQEQAGGLRELMDVDDVLRQIT